MTERKVELRWGGEPIPNLPFLHEGKVRDSYGLPAGPNVRFPFASNRVSVFDLVLNAHVADKGAVLTAMNIFWRRRLETICPHDLIAYGQGIREHLPMELRNRRKLQQCGTVNRNALMIPIEAIVRGYLTGTGREAYLETNPHIVCGHQLPDGLDRDGSRLPTPIFTPTTKATVGHDVHVTFQSVKEQYGPQIEAISLCLYKTAQEFALSRGIIIADTKFEFGLCWNQQTNQWELILCDEVLTPDSSRFWRKDDWEASLREGKPLRPFDKQHVRNWAREQGIHKRKPENPDDYARVRAQAVPQELLEETTHLYREILHLLTGMTLEEFQNNAMGIGL